MVCHIVTFCDFLGNLRKLSTQNTTKLENSDTNFHRNYLVVGNVYLCCYNWELQSTFDVFLTLRLIYEGEIVILFIIIGLNYPTLTKILMDHFARNYTLMIHEAKPLW